MQRYAGTIRVAISSLSTWKLLVLTFCMAGIVTVGFTQHTYHEEEEVARSNLSIIAELKTSEVQRWLAEKRMGLIQPPSGYLANALAEWKKIGSGSESDATLTKHLSFYLRRYPEASGLGIYDAQGQYILSTQTPHRSMPLQIDTHATPDGFARLVDFYINPVGQARLAFSVPLSVQLPAGERIIGFILLEIDPARYLYPFIQKWPSNSSSAESLLFRRTRTEVEYLNPLRHDPAAPLTKRASLNDQALLASIFATHSTQESQGHDYRGVPAFGASRLIENSPWRIVAKMDSREVYAGAFKESLYFGLFAFLVAAFITALLRQSHSRARNMASLRQQAKDMTLLRTFIDCVPESLFMTHKDGQVRIINTTGASRLGLTPEQIVGTNIWARLPPEIAAGRKAKVEETCRTNLACSLIDQRANVEYQHMFYPLGDGEHVVIIATDVTAKNADIKARNEAMQTLQGFIDHMPGIAYVKDHESRILMANQGFQEQLGINPLSMIGKLSSEVFPGEFGQSILAADLRILANDTPEVIEEEFDGHFYESTKFPIPRDNGHASLGGITLDVTARHHAEEALRQSEERLRLLTDNLPDSFLYQIALGSDGKRRLLYASSGVERVFGVSPAAAVDDINLILERIDPAQRPAVIEAQNHAISGEFRLDVHVRRADGSWGWIHMRSHMRTQPNAQHQLIWDGVASDVTALRHNEQLLALEARRTNALLDLPTQAEQMDEAIFISHVQDLAKQLTSSPIAFIYFVQENQGQMELVAWVNTVIPDYCKAALDNHNPLSNTGTSADASNPQRAVIINDYISANSQNKQVANLTTVHRLVSVPVVEGGQVRMIAGVGNKAEDYSELDAETLQLIADATWRIVRKRLAEAALQQAVQVVEASPAICFRWHAKEGWPVAFVSDNVRNWGYEPCDLIAGKPAFTTLIHPDDLLRVKSEIHEHIELGHMQYTQEYRLFKADGSSIWISDLTTVSRDTNGIPLFLDGVVTDISERKVYEIQLAENLAAQQALNRKLEEAHNQLLQAEKLSAIGQLASGVAHELNNPIGFVHSNLGTLTEYVTTLISLCDILTTQIENPQLNTLNLDEVRRIQEEQDYNYLRGDIFPLLEESRDGLNRVRKIVQDLRDFSRTGNQEWVVADLHKGLDSTLNIVANELKYKCQVCKEYGELPEIVCVISQINQVFMNLLINAAQSIEKQGVITLRSGMEDPLHVWISISDTGHGIPPEFLNRIFDPFFTTKPVGIGTGLGLSLVFGIITRHHGHIEVSSEPDKGTTFRIVLPVQQDAYTQTDNSSARETT